MREASRIERIVAKIGMLWLEEPDLRFGQLISNIFSRMGYNDMFYVEDDKLEEFLETLLQKYQTVVPMKKGEKDENRKV